MSTASSNICPFCSVDLGDCSCSLERLAGEIHDLRAREARLREALNDILAHFSPEHLDSVSGSTCGTEARAAAAPTAGAVIRGDGA